MNDIAHKYQTRIYYEDTDAGGVVYYANYLKFAERARTEFLRDLGYENSGLVSKYDCIIVVRSCSIDFMQSARLDDLITVRTELVCVSGASFKMQQLILRENEILVTIDVKLACINVSGGATRIPKSLMESLTDLV